MFREIRRHEKITDKFEKKEKGFMLIKPKETELNMEELKAFVNAEIKQYHEEIIRSMSN